MIGPSGNVRVYLACGVTDMRRGIDGLSALVEGVIKEAPGSGALFGFRGRRADRIKLLWWDGQGFCLFYKVLERGYFPWPTAKEGVAHLTQAQLSMLVEGIDWRRPAWTSAPGRVIPPFLTGPLSRIYAASFSFCLGVMPPIAILGLSLLYVQSQRVA